MIAGCNAISFHDNICSPKKIEDGMKALLNHDENVDHMSLCPLHGGCGDWIQGWDLTGLYDIHRPGRVDDKRQCVELCKSIPRCNAVTYQAVANAKAVCYPKSLPSGPGKTRPLNEYSSLEFMPLCLLQHECGTWLDGHDRAGQGDIQRSAKVLLLCCPAMH